MAITFSHIQLSSESERKFSGLFLPLINFLGTYSKVPSPMIKVVYGLKINGQQIASALRNNVIFIALTMYDQIIPNDEIVKSVLHEFGHYIRLARFNFDRNKAFPIDEMKKPYKERLWEKETEQYTKNMLRTEIVRKFIHDLLIRK